MMIGSSGTLDEKASLISIDEYWFEYAVVVSYCMLL